MPFYEKQVNAEGKEEFVLVEDDAIKLPDTHPLVVKNRELLKAAKEAKKVVATVDPADDEGDEEDEETVGAATPAKPVAKPAAKPRQPVAPVIDVDALRKELKAEIKAELVSDAKAETTASETRAVAVTAILKKSGLPETLRTVIDAIPDLTQAETHAQTLAKAGLRFEETPIGENGSRVDFASFLSKADEGLTLGDFDPTKKQ